MIFNFHTFSDVDISLTIQRTEFEKCSQPLLSRLEQFLNKAKTNLDLILKSNPKISFIELIGGSTRIPSVKQVISKVFPCEIRQSMNADECIALGCGFLAQEGFPFSVSDVNMFDIKAEWSQNGIRHETFLFKSGCPVPSTFELKMQMISIKAYNSSGVSGNKRTK